MSRATVVQAGAAAGKRRAGGAALAAWRARWKALERRERVLVASATALLVGAVVWWVGLQPAWQTLRTAPARLDALDAQSLAMRRLAAEAVQLRQAPVLGSAQAALALKAASERLGAAARLSVQGERAVLTLESVDPAALRDWLAEVRTGARARPVEAQLQQNGAGFSGTVTVVIPASP